MSNFQIAAECKTKETGLDGVRDSEWSAWSSNTAPEGYVINDRIVKHEWVSRAGSENKEEVIFFDHVEIVSGTGLKFPRSIKVRVYARGPKGHASGRGWSQIKVSGDYIKYA